jgi:hypothetical protein
MEGKAVTFPLRTVHRGAKQKPLRCWHRRGKVVETIRTLAVRA